MATSNSTYSGGNQATVKFDMSNVFYNFNNPANANYLTYLNVPNGVSLKAIVERLTNFVQNVDKRDEVTGMNLGSFAGEVTTVRSLTQALVNSSDEHFYEITQLKERVEELEKVQSEHRVEIDNLIQQNINQQEEINELKLRLDAQLTTEDLVLEVTKKLFNDSQSRQTIKQIADSEDSNFVKFPESILVIPAAFTAKVEWEMIDGAETYNVYYNKTGLAPIKLGNTPTNAVTLSGLIQNSDYELFVRSVKNGKESLPSPVVTFKTKEFS